MNVKHNTGFSSKPVVLLQSVAWYLLGFWFALSAVLLAIGYKSATTISLIGILIVLATIVGRILFMAELFRRAKLYRLAVLCYLLLLILIATSIAKSLM